MKKIINVEMFYHFLTEFNNPRRILNVLVLIFCLSISTFQLIGCIDKLRHPPVSTHYRFVLNDTLDYPAVTICRNPAYNVQKLSKFNLRSADISITSEWMNFPFHNSTLQQVWEQATYPQSSTLIMYGLHGFAENAKVRKTYHLMHGQCFTLMPRVATNVPWPKSGWSVLLNHDGVDKSNNFESETPGYHIYVHEVREPWLENELQTFSIMEYTYLEVGEEMKIRVRPEQYNQVSTFEKSCVNNINYSAALCAEKRRWLNITRQLGCTGPWMPGVNLPQCNTYKKLNRLINNYLEFDGSYDWGCKRSCNSTAYKMTVVNRVPMERPLSHFYLYYSSKMVTVLQEMYAYDWNSFLADLGGSLGFFLGLSVVGMIGLFEKGLRFVMGCKRQSASIVQKLEFFERVEKY